MDPTIVAQLQGLGFSVGEACILGGVLAQLGVLLIRVRRVEALSLENSQRLDAVAPKRAALASLN
jgi:hypothetical protein